MPQYLKIYAPGAGIGKHKNIFISIERKVLLPSLLKKESLQTWSQCTRKAWKQKDCERELHFLKHLIISNQNVVLEAWLTVFKLLKPCFKAANVDLIPTQEKLCLPSSLHSAQGGEEVGSWGGKANQNNSEQARCYPLLQKCLLRYHHCSNRFTQGTTWESSNPAAGKGESPTLLLLLR